MTQGGAGVPPADDQPRADAQDCEEWNWRARHEQVSWVAADPHNGFGGRWQALERGVECGYEMTNACEEEEASHFVDGWSEAAAAAGWIWDECYGEGWGGEAWPADGAEWMADSVVHGGKDQGEEWSRGIEMWEAGTEGSRHWKDDRLDAPRGRMYRGRQQRTGPWPRGGKSHIYVPRRVDLEQRFKERNQKEEVTTLMIRNVPNRYDRWTLMQELDELGFRGKYDFLYLPIDNATRWNVGYAFVNFDEPKDAHECMLTLDGHQFFRYRSSKKRVAQVSVAHIQGLEQNLAHCQGTSVFSTQQHWLRPWVRKWTGSKCQDRQSSDEQDTELELDIQIKEQDADMICPSSKPSPESSLTSAALCGPTVELRIGSGESCELWTAIARQLVSNGTKRLKLVPDMCSKGSAYRGSSTSANLRAALKAFTDLPELSNLEIEIEPTAIEQKALPMHGPKPDRPRWEEMMDEAGWKFQPEGDRSSAHRRTSSAASWRKTHGQLSARPSRRRSVPAGSRRGAEAGTAAGGEGANSQDRQSPAEDKDQPHDRRPESTHLEDGALGNPADMCGAQAGGYEGAPHIGAAVWGLPDAEAGGGWPHMLPSEEAFYHGGAPSYGWQQGSQHDPAQGWPTGFEALSEYDFRICYMCPEAWVPGCWAPATSGGEMEEGAQCLSDPHSADVTSDGIPREPAATEGLDGADGSVSSGDVGIDANTRGPVTTLLLRNVPANYTQDMLLAELESLGLHTTCDFAYLPSLPMTPVAHWNVGCAFVNFRTPEDAEQARVLLIKHMWQSANCSVSHKNVDVADAVIQGYEENMAHYNLTAIREMGWEWCGSAATTCVPSFASIPSSPMTLATEIVEEQVPFFDDMAGSLCSWDSTKVPPQAVSRTPSPSPEPHHTVWPSPQMQVGPHPVRRSRSPAPRGCAQFQQDGLTEAVAPDEMQPARCRSASSPTMKPTDEITNPLVAPVAGSVEEDKALKQAAAPHSQPMQHTKSPKTFARRSWSPGRAHKVQEPKPHDTKPPLGLEWPQLGALDDSAAAVIRRPSRGPRPRSRASRSVTIRLNV